MKTKRIRIIKALAVAILCLGLAVRDKAIITVR
jgi:hypothetical protein